jgi:hypothetical protein
MFVGHAMDNYRSTDAEWQSHSHLCAFSFSSLAISRQWCETICKLRCVCVCVSCPLVIAPRGSNASHLLDTPPSLIMNKRQHRLHCSMEKWYGHWTIITDWYVWSFNNNNNNNSDNFFCTYQDKWLIWPSYAKSRLLSFPFTWSSSYQGLCPT